MGLPMETRSDSKVADVNDNTEDAESTVKKRRTTSKLAAATHLFKGSVGAGLFAMGDAFKNGGLVAATVLLPIIAIICVHCEQMLIDCSVWAVERTPEVDFYDYPETVQKCFEYGPRPFRKFSKAMKLIVEMFLCVTQFGFCSVYFVFITENLHQVLEQNGIHWSSSVVMLITLIPVMIPSLMTNLKYISPVSFVANCSLIFGVVATLVLAFDNGSLPSPSERHYITDGTHLSLFFGTALFSYEGIALILPLRNAMKDPYAFSRRFGVLNVTMFLVTLLFIFTGAVSYLRWGEDVQGSITLNLNVEDVLSQVIKMVAALGVFFGYPIQFFVMIKIIWTPLKKSSAFAQKHPISTQVAFRFLFVLLTISVAMVVPQLGLFISLIGALCSTCLAFVIPVLIDFVIRAQIPKGLGCWVYLKNIVILVIAFMGIITGTYQSIVEIVHAFRT